MVRQNTPKQYQTRLHLRDHTYYIRVAVLKALKTLEKRNEIRYSLGTKDYFTAIERLRRENYKINLYFEWLKGFQMELKDKKIIFTDIELQQLLTYKMRMIDDTCDNHYYQIKNGTYPADNIKTFGNKQLADYNKETFDENAPDEQADSPNDIQFIKHQFNKLVYDYMEWLNKRPETKVSTKELITKIKEGGYQLFQLKEQDKDSELPNQMLSIFRHLLDIDQYTEEKFAKLQGKTTSIPKSSMIRTLESAVEYQKSQELSGVFKTRTTWLDAFADMIRPAKNAGNVSTTTLNEKKQCLSFIMELLDKEYVEDINYDDCKKLNRLIYRVPKNASKKYPDKKLIEVLIEDEDDREEGLSMTSIYKYLAIFKEFLKYCRKQRLLSEDLADLIDSPKRIKGKNPYSPFTDEELCKIFDPVNYCKYTKDGQEAPKFFVPLISLFSGARLNEICQIRMEDIIEDDDIVYFHTSDKHPLQSLKNDQSKRRIPFHPVLKKMGLFKYIHQQKRNNEEWLFPTLLKQYDPKKHKFGKNVGRSFARYLERLGITEKSKVFHSFRHTVRPKLRDECRLSQEYIDALCGWEGTGGNAGTKNYSHKEQIPIRMLNSFISKIKYPKLNPLFTQINERIKLRKKYYQ